MGFVQENKVNELAGEKMIEHIQEKQRLADQLMADPTSPYYEPEAAKRLTASRRLMQFWQNECAFAFYYLVNSSIPASASTEIRQNATAIAREIMEKHKDGIIGDIRERIGESEEYKEMISSFDPSVYYDSLMTLMSTSTDAKG